MEARGVVHVYRIGSETGGLRHRPMQWSLKPSTTDTGLMGFPAQVRPTPSAVADANGTLWFATAGNLVSVDPLTLRFRVNPTDNFTFRAVLVNGTTFLSQSESTSDRAENNHSIVPTQKPGI